MRISSNLILLATAAIPGINGSSFVSRGLITAQLASQKVTEKRELADGFDMDMSNPATICALMLFASAMDPDATMTTVCNEDFTEMTATNTTAMEICDDKNEFCQKNTLMSTTFPLAAMLGESEEMSEATLSICTTYTKVPSDEFTELVDKELCVNGTAKVDMSNMMGGMDGDGQEASMSTDTDTVSTSASASTNTDTDSEMLESCTANIGDDICTCSVCENNEVKLLCPTLGFNTVGGCTTLIGEDDSPVVMRFTKVEPTESAASVALPLIGLFITLTLSAVLI